MLYLIPLSILVYVLYRASVTFSDLYLHPLRHIPGPKLWIAFPILRHISHITGNLEIDTRAFHTKYGEAVRIGPDEVSFITAQAWKDIYGHGQPQMRKVRSSASNPLDIISANGPDHTRHRRSLAHAFSARGLQAQEPILIEYVDKLIARLHGIAESQLPANMVKWYNLTTFDLIGDLAYGESFGGLESSEYHHWVAAIFDSVRVLAVIALKDAYPLISKLFTLFVPGRLAEARKKHLDHSRELVEKRLKSNTDRGHADFMQSMLRHRGEKEGLTDQELEANANILIIAGSETTATLLSGVTFWLLRTPKAMEKVVHEVRSLMKTEKDITFNNVTANLPYMLACINEGLRMYPPVPSGLRRISPPTPVEVSGYKISPNTKLSVHQISAYTSPLNFHDLDRFVPERWLPEEMNNPSSPFYNDKRDVLQPFSFGPRNCIGKNLAYNEMRLILARILWNFDLELCQESWRWNEQKSYALWDKPALMFIATLAAVEDCNPPSYVSLHGEECNEFNEPNDPEVAGTSDARPITRGLGSAIKHLRARGGGSLRSCLRGFDMYFAYTVITTGIGIGISTLIGFVTKSHFGVLLGHFIASMLLPTWLMAWVHHMIANKPPRRNLRQMPGLRNWSKIAPAATLYNGLLCAFLAVPGTFSSPAKFIVGNSIVVLVNAGHGVSFGDLLIGILSLLVFPLVTFPARAIFIRVAASMLPEEDEPIVPFGRRFGGKSLAGGGQLSIRDAWTSFEWAARVRFVKTILKAVAIEAALFVAMILLILGGLGIMSFASSIQASHS
ncbi:cytochrome P450 [Aspergillus steynii IBT 23096]|uniref:Cytochrome P450 n=1 Tax=Aspergillus steynii IBT 23096 TaxID=1392250 RepID=A0A2I2GD19_9EURO|nr:cytochrome P450 [Aspergillus steynii IBT 23096]PLB50796.1 cytochrome P450 [Aspergillus steynii IBT 23096]